MDKKKSNPLLDRLRYHVSGAIERGEAEAISGQPANVAAFEVRDLGEDGSQYFPGVTAAFSKRQRAEVGMGDTAREALEDAFETLSQDDVHFTQEQQAEALASLRNPDRSAHAELEAHDCEKDECDWHHYVAIFYDLNPEGK